MTYTMFGTIIFMYYYVYNLNTLVKTISIRFGIINTIKFIKLLRHRKFEKLIMRFVYV